MSGGGASLAYQPAVLAPLQFRLGSGGTNAKESFVVCPKCDVAAFIRRSTRITPKVKHLFCHCTNSACGHIFQLEMVFVGSLVEGNIDRPDLDLPVLPRDQLAHVIPPDGRDDERQSSMFASDIGPDTG